MSEASERWPRSIYPVLVVLGLIGWAISGYALRFRDGISDRGDPLLTAWILAWDQHQILRDPFRLFQANIFHPFSDTLAYSEHVFGPAMLAFPARLFTDNAISVQNFSFLTAFLALGIASYLFFLWISGSPISAACGAVLLTLAPVRFPQLGHIQMLHSAGIPLLLYGLWSYLETGRRSAMAIFLGALLFEILTSFYLGFMALLCVALFLLVAPLRFGLNRVAATIGRLAPGTLAVAVLAVPFVLPYWRLRTQLGFVRTLEGNEGNWASPRAYFRPYPGSLTSRIAASLGFAPGASTYLGFLTLLLALVGVLELRKRNEIGSPRARLAALFLLALGVVSFALSLGGWRMVRGHRVRLPFYWIHQLPGVDGIRATVRFSILVDLAVVGLAVIGLARLFRRIADRRSPVVASLAVAGLGALAFAERVPRLPIAPRERIEVGAEIPHVYRWLAKDSSDARLIELPMGVGPGEHEPWDVVPYKQVFFSTVHWKKIVNGTSGYQPPNYGAVSARMGSFPSDESLEALRWLPINRVVINRKLYPFEISADVFAREGFRVLHECPDDFVVEVRPIAAERPRTMKPRLRLVAKSDGERTVRVRLEWSPDMPAFLYPPLGFRMALRGRDESARATERMYKYWLSEPRQATTYLVAAGPRVRSLALEVSTETGEKATGTWEFSPAFFYTVPGCRVVDTRRPIGMLGGPAFAGDSDRVFPLAGHCEIPSTARAISVNVTIREASAVGDIRLYPGGTPLPVSSTINYGAGQARSNHTFVPLGADGSLGVRCDQPTGTVHVILEVDGYFE